MNAPIPDSAHWRDTAREVKFFFVDSKAAFPFLLFLLHMRLWTFLLATFMMMFFGALAHFGFTMPVFKRWLRATMAGRHKFSRPWWV